MWRRMELWAAVEPEEADVENDTAAHLPDCSKHLHCVRKHGDPESIVLAAKEKDTIGLVNSIGV